MIGTVESIVVPALGFAVIFYLLQQSPSTMDARGLGYQLSAQFENVGDLKAGSPLTVAGIRIGVVTDIKYDAKRGKVAVTMRVASPQHRFPTDSILAIRTQSLLGGKMVEMSPGHAASLLRDGDEVKDTRPSVIYEKLVDKAMVTLADRMAARATQPP